MATYPVKFENEDTWAVFQSTSCSMFSPTFSNALEAHIFAAHYWMRNSVLPHEEYSDYWQTNFASDIHMFVDERMPEEEKTNLRVLPVEWIKEFDPEPWYWNPAEDGAYESAFDSDNLVEAFEEGKRSIVDVVMVALAEWINARKPKAPEVSSASV